jgi:hypothetical protein
VVGGIYPEFLPDGQHFLCVGFVRGRGNEVADLYIGRLDRGTAQRIQGVHSRAQFMNGRLYYADQGYVVSRRFDPRTATFEGDPVTLGELHDACVARTGNAVFAANAGVVAWLDQGAEHRALWFDRSGDEIGRLNVPTSIRRAEISPDGKRVAADIAPSGRAGDIWVCDLEREVSEPLIASPADESNPIWSPDGDRIAYSSDLTGGPSVWTIATEGGGTPVQLPGSVTGAAYPSDWSPDGKTIAFVETAVEANMQIRFIASHGDSASQVFSEGPGWRWGLRFSPDGRWVVFASGELGTPEIFVAPRSDGGALRRVSISGGFLPLWGREGREILYVAGKGTYPIRENVFYRVEFTGDPFSISRPERLFALEPSLELTGADVSSDGERFLCIVSDPREAWSNIHVLVEE